MKLTQALVFIALIIGIVSLTIGLQPEIERMGNIFVNPDSYTSGDVNYASSTLSSGAEEVLSRATSSRRFARICNRTGEGTVYLYKIATSTGVVVNGGGFPISTSTAHANCMTINSDDPYRGAVWAVSSASTTVSIESIQE